MWGEWNCEIVYLKNMMEKSYHHQIYSLPWLVVQTTVDNTERKMSTERRIILSPIDDMQQHALVAQRELIHTATAISFGKPTSQIVASSLNSAIAALRSGEVVSVPSTRILRADYRLPVSKASSISDVTPKRVIHDEPHRVFL